MNTQTLKKYWAKLHESEQDMLLGAVTGFFLGMTVLHAGAPYQAHFFQRAYESPTEETLVMVSPAQWKVAVAEPQETLRAAAPEESSSSSSAEISSITQESSSAAAAASSEAASAPASSAAASSAAPVIDDAFPALGRTAHPVSLVPNWGAMRGEEQWGRSYREMTRADFVPVPAYNLKTLTIPFSSLISPVRDEDIPLITAKLYYSTRYMAKYDLDADEYSGTHDGVDLKLAPGTPVGSIGGGRVYAVREDAILGKHVLVEHRAGGVYYLSIYGHLSSVSVAAGQDVTTGQTIGTVGMTGNTSAPHLHLAVHTSDHQGTWNTYAANESMNPMVFIAAYRQGE